MIARVAVFAPVERAFDYRVPPTLRRSAWARACGRRSAGARSRASCSRSIRPTPSRDAKPLARVVDAPPVGGDLVALAAWVAEYYCAPLGEVLRLMLPAGGAARARRTLALTDEGTRAAAGLCGALEPLALQGLDGEARALLARSRAATAKRRATARRRRRRCARWSSAGSSTRRRGGVDARGAHRHASLRVAAPLDDGGARGGVRARRAARRDLDRIAAAGTHRAVGAAPGRRARRRSRARARRGGAGRDRDARAGQRSVRRRARRSTRSPPTLTAAQAAALAAIEPTLATRRVRAVSPARRHRLGQDRGLPARDRRGARGRAGARWCWCRRSR